MPPRPPAGDPRRVVEYVRRVGPLAYPVRSAPDDVIAWRAELRRHARLQGVRISVRRRAAGWVVASLGRPLPLGQDGADERGGRPAE